MTYSNAVQEPEVDEELWAVRLATGETRVMTLEQLDAAFQAGHIDEETAVIEAGGSQWVRLGDILGGDDEAPQSGPAAYAPAANDVYGDAGYQQHGYAQPQPVYAQQTYAQPTYGQNPYAQQPAYSQDPYAAPAPAYGYDHGPSQAPMVMQAAPNHYAQSLPPGLNSMRPVVSEVSDFELDDAFKPKKRGRAVVAMMVVALLGGGGYVASRNPAVMTALQGVTGQHAEEATASVAAAAAVQAPVAAPAPVTPDPVFVPPSPGGGALAAALSEPAPIAPLSEAQKAALAKADKAHASKHRSKSAGTSSSPAPKKHKGGSPFHNGGDKYDPLNASL